MCVEIECFGKVLNILNKKGPELITTCHEIVRNALKYVTMTSDKSKYLRTEPG